MHITRFINGEPVRIELTQQELREAYLEQQAAYDLQDIMNFCSEPYDEDFYGISKDEFIKLSGDMAINMRKNIDKYDMCYEDAVNEAVMDVINAYQRNKTDEQ